jgi:hypothetical protein
VESVVQFSQTSVEIYPDGSPAIGTGLNYPAEVVLTALPKSARYEFSSPDMQYIDSGDGWVRFQVPHWTKYSILDDAAPPPNSHLQ